MLETIKTGFENAQRLTVAELFVIAAVVGLIVAIAIPAYQSIS